MISIDSNIFTYLIQAVTIGYNPNHDEIRLANEKVAIMRIFLHCGDFVILPTVIQEYNNISNQKFKDIHDSFSTTQLVEINSMDGKKFTSIYESAKKYHNKDRDCKIFAEAVASDINTILTFDNNFIKKLNGKRGIKIMRPSEYWENLKIEKGSAPKWQPHDTNPLSKNTYWKW